LNRNGLDNFEIIINSLKVRADSPFSFGGDGSEQLLNMVKSLAQDSEELSELVSTLHLLIDIKYQKGL
jgi:hypothetical protein